MSAGILSQTSDDDILRPAAFFSKKLSPTECNYEIYDKELLAIIRCFEEWRPELEGAASPVQVITDHKNLEYFMSTRNLNRRQARWPEFLSRFNFHIMYRPGKLGAKPDSLTRRSQDLPHPGDPRLQHQSQVVLKSHNLPDFPEQQPPMSLDALETMSQDSDSPENHDPSLSPEDDFDLDNGEEDSSPEPLDTQIRHAYAKDDEIASVLQCLRDGTRRHPLVSLSQCTEENGRLFFNNRLWIPASPPL